MTQKQKTPAPAAAPSADNLYGNAEAIHMAGKMKAALENIMSAPLENKKLSELPTKKERLLALADAIERAELTKRDIGFNMAPFHAKNLGFRDQTGHSCGTVACIAGWAALIDDPSNTDENYIETRAQGILKLTDRERVELFYAADAGEARGRISSAQAVAVLRDFAKNGKVRWNKFNSRGKPI